jgi:lipopolysaccharide biosynthesis regulator YciM
MISNSAKLRVSANRNGKFTFECGEKSMEFTFEKTFAYGHTCLKAKEYAAAARIFKTLLQAQNVDCSVMVMLALCEAKLGHTEECQKILQDVFEGKDEPLAEKLHFAFGHYNSGMPPEVVEELVEIMTERTDLPAVNLIVGDLLRTTKQWDRAAACWQAAIKRDDRGEVAMTARRELARLKIARARREKDA